MEKPGVLFEYKLSHLSSSLLPVVLISSIPVSINLFPPSTAPHLFSSFSAQHHLNNCTPKHLNRPCHPLCILCCEHPTLLTFLPCLHFLISLITLTSLLSSYPRLLSVPCSALLCLKENRECEILYHLYSSVSCHPICVFCHYTSSIIHASLQRCPS